jgi:hypothetical protein
MIKIENFKTYSISNILIAICFIVTSIVISVSDYYIYWINSLFLSEWMYWIFIFQLFAWVFMHGWILHLLANSLFIYLFWNILEWLIWIKNYIMFFIITVLFTGISLILFSNWNTVWISWFAMALLWFYTIRLYKLWNSDYKWWITAIIINIAIWLSPWISLIGHLSGVIIWIIYWIFYKK